MVFLISVSLIFRLDPMSFDRELDVLFSLILGCKLGDSLQVHACGDPGMEMMPECNICMCSDHFENNVF